MQNKKAPTNIDIPSILSYQLPLPGLISILHRISGFVIFLMMPLLLWILSASLESKTSFLQLKECLSGFFIKLIIWGVLSAIAYHLVAGIRHMLMDLGIGETLSGGYKGAQLTLVVSMILIVWMGVWLW